MGATLDALHRLQEVELQLAEIQQGIDRKRRAVEKQESRIAELDASIKAQEAALRSEQIEADGFDLEIKSREAEIAKFRQALNLAKTNKEYSALLTQLNSSKADNSKLEEKALALLGQVDAKRKQIAAIAADHEKESARLEELENRMRRTQENAKDRVAALTEKRDAAAAEVPPQALAFFNRVAKKNDGEALARVVRTNPKREEYACDGCNMAITLEQVNAMLSRDEAILCNICGRILYMEAHAPSGAS